MLQTIRNHRHEFIPAVILFAVSVLFFIPSLHYEMLNWDDEYYIHANAWLLNFTWDNVWGVFTHSYFSNYHPLTMLSYMVDFHLWGYDPAGYRAVNIVLHGLTVAAGYWLLRTLGTARWPAFFLLLFFAIHPLRLESVVWISERKDVLSGLFYVLALVFWVLGSKKDQATHRTFWWLSAAGVAVLLSLFSKAMAVSFPLVVLLHDLLLRRDLVIRRIPLYVGLLVLAAIFMVANIRAQTTAMSEGVPLSWRLALAAYSPVHYGSKTLVPVGLSPFYPYELRPTQHAWAIVAAIVVNLGALVLVVWGWRKQPVLAWGLLSSAIILGPVSGIVTFGGAWAADRYSYLPTLALLAGVGPLLTGWLEKLSVPRKRIAALSGSVYIAIMGTVSVHLLPVWENSRVFWDRVAEVFPESSRAEVNRIQSEQAGDERDEEMEAPLEIPIDWRNVPAAAELAVQTNLRRGNHDAALEATEGIPLPAYRHFWRMRIERDRGNWQAAASAARDLVALDDPPALASFRANAAYTLIRAGAPQEARQILEAITEPTRPATVAWPELAEHTDDPAERIDMARRSLAIFPGEARSLRLLGETLRAQDRLHAGWREFEKAARHRLTAPGTRGYAFAMMGLIEQEHGRERRAERYFERAFHQELSADLEPEMKADIHNFLGWVAEEVNRLADAERLYTKALQANPQHLDAHLNLAFIRLRQGRPHDAVELLESALRHHSDNQAARENLQRIRERLEQTE